MKPTPLILAAITGLLLTAAHARTWISAAGARTFDGELTSCDPDTGLVGVKLANGQALEFSTAVISKADIAFLKQQGKVEAPYSRCVRSGADGKLQYFSNKIGDVIPDFSYCGYMGGGVRLPDAPVKITLEPADGDDGERNCGVEKMRVVSEYDASLKKGGHFVDEAHALNSITIANAADCWVRDVWALHFYHGCVIIGGSARNITVQDSRSEAMVSELTGGRRYPFNVNGHLCLVQRCTTDTARHAFVFVFVFVFGARVPGPNVFLDCKSTNDHGSTTKMSSSAKSPPPKCSASISATSVGKPPAENPALIVIGQGKADWIVPHVDLLLSYLNHEETWLRNAAMTALVPVAADERVYQKVLPPIGELIRTNQRPSLALGLLPQIREKIIAAGPKVQQLAIKTLQEAYAGYTGKTTAPGGLNISTHLDSHLEYIGLNRSKLKGYADAKVQSVSCGPDTLDGLVGLHSRAENDDYQWRTFVDIRREEWSCHSFEPIAKEQVPFDQIIDRYRDVTMPTGMEKWFASDFDPDKAGWQRGKAPFGQYLGKIPQGPVSKCSPSCTGPNCYGAEKANTLWDKEVILLRKKVTVPPLKEGHRYRLRVHQRAHVGNGGGYGVWVNGKPMIEKRNGLGRGGGEKPYGAYITKEWFDDFAKGEVTIAVKSFLRFNDKYSVNPTKSEPQGFISVDIEEQKLPPLGDDLVRQSAKCVSMFSSEWQAAQFSDSDEERQQAPKFNWDGKFVANPQVLGGWKLVGQTDTIEAFNPAAKPVAPRQPVATTLQLADKGETGNPLLIWSGDRMMDLARYQALQMKTKTIGDKEYLFLEAGGFSTKNQAGWLSPWLVFTRN